MIIEIRKEELAIGIVKSLVEHYCQDIHLTDASNVPYFDPLLGTPTKPSPFSAHLKDKLNDATLQATSFEVGKALFESYDLIRDKCFQFTKRKILLEPTAHVVLIQYEQLLSHYIGSFDAGIGEHHDILDDAAEEMIQSVHAAAVKMMLDIFSLTSVEKAHMARETIGIAHAEAKDRLCNIILPVLIRILQHYIIFLQQILASFSEQNDSQQSDLKYLISLASFVALTFCRDEVYQFKKSRRGIKLSSSNMHVEEVLPAEFGTELTLNHIFLNNSSYSPTIVPPAPTPLQNNESYLDGLLTFTELDSEHFTFMDEPFIDVKNSSAAVFPMQWLDHTKGIGARAASSLLHHLASLAQCLSGETSTKEVHESIVADVLCFEGILMKQVGKDYVCQLAREFFFGRLTVPPSCRRTVATVATAATNISFKSESSRSLAFNGILQDTKIANDCDDEEAQKERPARCVATIRIFAALKFPDVSTAIGSEALPVIFTLIDSCHCHLQAFGASLLLHLLRESTSTSFLSATQNPGDQHGIFHNTAQILSLACRTCDGALPLYILSKASYSLFEMLPPQEMNTLRRNSASALLNRILKSSHGGPGAKDETLELLCAMLGGSLQPLLHKLAQLPDANAMELGRQGLSVLLPLIRWDSNTRYGRRIQVASMACLTSLMMGAYPMMIRHGGKITSELLSCVGRAQRDLQIQKKVQSRFGTAKKVDHDTKATIMVAVHTASAALVLCGNSAAEALTNVEHGSYSTEMKKSCSLIRRCSERHNSQTFNTGSVVYTIQPP
jgi:hypothetical protein